jgi:hypothetical protein
VLFIISSDPRVSHRPAEAIRIAVGTGAWARAEVNVCLTGAATLMLNEGEEALKDADQFSAFCAKLEGRSTFCEKRSRRSEIQPFRRSV